MRRLNHARILMYSHDTFGLGHLRRCRAIAHALVEEFKGLQVLIISGSSIAGAFNFKARVDFLKIPSVIKLRDGDYTSMAQHIDLSDTLAMRRALILDTAKMFQPDLMIVDKEPLGLRGEMLDTLEYLRAQGTVLALGLRDVMDAPHLLEAEWRKNDVLARIEALYDAVWVYGPPEFHDPLIGLDVSPGLRERITYTGFLRRSTPHGHPGHPLPDEDYILVTIGGGGDGGTMVSQVLSALEYDMERPYHTVLVLGPFMPAEEREHLRQRAERLPRVTLWEFDSRIEHLMAGAQAIVGMGGYNTFTEILSFDKPALIVPRVQPRQEQLIRARRAQELGLTDMLHPDEASDPRRVAAMLRALPHRPPPSSSPQPARMDGLETVRRLVGESLGHHPAVKLAADG